MKKIIFIALMVIMYGATYAQGGMKFTGGTLNEICSIAAKENKLVFVDVYTTWCGPCKFMTANIFPDSKVGAYMNGKFINAKFDAEKGEGIEIAAKYNVKAYPTMLILNSDGTEVTRLLGRSATPEEFLKMMETRMKKAETIK